jgi:hypothetical protein
MTASVAVDYRCFICGERAGGCIEHGIDQSCIRPCADRPAHLLAVEAVDHRREIHLTSWQLEFRNVREPLLVRSTRIEVTGKQILWGSSKGTLMSVDDPRGYLEVFRAALMCRYAAYMRRDSLLSLSAIRLRVH